MLTLFIESIKIKNPCQIKPQNLYDKDYQRFIKELGLDTCPIFDYPWRS